MSRRIAVGAALGMVFLVAFGLGWFLRGVAQDLRGTGGDKPQPTPYLFADVMVGRLLPQERCGILAPRGGQILEITIPPSGQDIVNGQNLMLMYDADLEITFQGIQNEIASLEKKLAMLNELAPHDDKDPASRIRRQVEREEMALRVVQKRREFSNLLERTGGDPKRLGCFWIKAPFGGRVLNPHVHDKLLNRRVRTNEPLLRIGNPRGQWEIEMKIPQKQIGRILQAFDENKQIELDVDFWLPTNPGQVYKGKLHRHDVAGEATPDPDGEPGGEPVIIALVRISGPSLPESERIPEQMLFAGAEVSARIRDVSLSP